MPIQQSKQTAMHNKNQKTQSLRTKNEKSKKKTLLQSAGPKNVMKTKRKGLNKEADNLESEENLEQKVSKKRKTDPKVKNEGEKMKLDFQRTFPPNGCKKFVGAHTSIQGGLANAVFTAVAIKGQSFGLFLRSQRTWAAKPLQDDVVEAFKNACRDFNFPSHLIIPHGSYLLNCGSPDLGTLEKSRACLVDELKRCEKLGIGLYNFHPGSTCGKISIEECLDRIAESINQAHAQTKRTITVIENMSKQGYTVGGDFNELKEIIKRVKNKSRIGVCLDTCHAFAAGYNLSKKEGYEKMMSDFESIIGIKYLKAAHLNDSKGEVGCHLDRHENIGRGMIGLKGFSFLMNDPRFDNIPLILETPLELDDREEIEILYSLVKK